MSPNLNILQITSSTFTLLAVMLNVLGQFLALFFTDKNTQQTLQLVLFDFNCGIFEYLCMCTVCNLHQAEWTLVSSSACAGLAQLGMARSVI